MSATVDVFEGATLTFSSSFAAEILSMDHSGISRAVIETTHSAIAAAGSGKFGNKTYIPSDLNDPGTLTLEIHFNPDTTPPIEGSTETATIQFEASGGDTTGASWAGSAFLSEFSWTGALEGKMTASMTLQFSGNITITAGA